MIKAEVKGLALTTRNLQMLEDAGVRSIARIVRGVTWFAAKSAASWSRPMPSKSYKQVLSSAKYGKRPLVKIQGRAKLKNGKPSGYTYVKRNNQMFNSKKPISKKERDKRGLVEVTKAVKYWNKKGNQWAYAPYNPRTKKPSRRVLRTGRKIPGAGAVKAGWMHASKLAGKSLGPTPHLRKSLGVGWVRKDRGQLTNKVHYASQIAKSVPRLAEKKAWNWLKNDLWRKEKAKLEAIKL